MNLRPVALLSAFALGGCALQSPHETALDDALRRRIDAPPIAVAEDSAIWTSVRAAYWRNDGAPLWLDARGPRESLRALRRELERAADEGLDPRAYMLDFVDAIPRAPTPLGRRYVPEAAAGAELRITWTALRYARDLQRGRHLRPETLADWGGAVRDDLGGWLQAAVAGGTLDGAFDALRPVHPQYERLRGALRRHRAVAERGGWPAIPGDLRVEPGDAAPGVGLLRARLGVAAADPALESVFDADLESALRGFQHDHGLVEDGRLGPATIAALNVPVEHRIAQIELALERWRWLPEALGERHVLVNVPSFHLEAHGAGAPLVMRVVTGKPHSPTPIFADAMETVVFSPWWHVPASIVRDEIAPGLMRDASYLARKNMQVVVGGREVDPWSVDLRDPAVRIKQRPGAGNSLGHVKFLFPNEHDVYLHDTPADSLFAKPQRAQSHGCVRVEAPDALAEWVLQGVAEWTPERIREAMHSGRERHVRLPAPIPVRIVYQTVWVEDDGRVRFLPDVYRHDERQLALLGMERAAPAVAAN